MRTGRPPMDQIKRFWSSVNKNGTIHPIHGKCWEWTGGLINGYGQFNSRKFPTPYAHRTSWEIRFGCTPIGWVLHKCDNRKCVNPDHLFIGDANDNKQDCIEKERHARGEKVNTAVLTETEAMIIKDLWRTKKYTKMQLARKFNRGWTLIHNLVTGKTWKHIK